MRFLLWVSLGCFLLGCGNGGNGGGDAGDDSGVFLCDLTDNLCPEGQRCNKDQECVAADPLQITTDSLPDGRINFGYSQQIEASGGLLPYSWAITSADAGLEFLTISSFGRLEGTTAQPVENASITITVTDDGYGGGESASRTYTISFVTCQQGDTELCYLPQGGVCYQGFRTCENGQMSDCQAGPNPSSDDQFCGPDCSACDGSVSDACVDGLCACGTGAICGGSDRCCSGACMDVSDNIENCGGCGADCNVLVVNASSAVITCSNGTCDYTGDCDYDWLDCDSRRSNGCEQRISVENCGECDKDCRDLVSHVRTDQKTCEDFTTHYECDYDDPCDNDFGDCDADRSNGCETYLNDPQNCSGCGVDCSVAPEGDLCLTPNQVEPYVHVCGCEFNSADGTAEGCNAGQICCDHVCEDPEDNPDHCGVCRAACTTGGCVGTACGCASDQDCPNPSSATSCGAGQRCVCLEANNQACPAGQFCCDGQAGGSGGPNEDPDIGCCPKACSWNDVDFPCTQ